MIDEASLSGVLKIILYIVLFSFLIRLVARMALPYVLKKSQEAMRDQMRQQYGSDFSRPRNEGEVTIETSKRPKGRSNNDDYVDYVEIKE